jgi:RNA polymerase sigma factor (TIGR02999 family)
MSDVTRILSQIEQGDPQAAELLLPLIYDELRKLAAAKLAHEKPGQTLQATALVHEAYLRLVASGGREPPEADRAEISGQKSEVRRQKSELRDQKAGETPASATSDLRPLTSAKWNSRGHFFAAAAEAMRRILVERARRKQTEKRGGKRERQELHDDVAIQPPDDSRLIDLVALDDALRQLEAVEPIKARLVKLRYFAGVPLEDAARLLDISPATAKRYWIYARSWLYGKLQGQ